MHTSSLKPTVLSQLGNTPIFSRGPHSPLRQVRTLELLCIRQKDECERCTQASKFRADGPSTFQAAPQLSEELSFLPFLPGTLVRRRSSGQQATGSCMHPQPCCHSHVLCKTPYAMCSTPLQFILIAADICCPPPRPTACHRTQAPPLWPPLHPPLPRRPRQSRQPKGHRRRQQYTPMQPERDRRYRVQHKQPVRLCV